MFAHCATTLALRERWNGETVTNWEYNPPIQEKIPIIYGGTRMDLRLLTAWKPFLCPVPEDSKTRGRLTHEWAPVAACAGTIDILPSFLLDTVLLPVTIIWSLFEALTENAKTPATEYSRPENQSRD